MSSLLQWAAIVAVIVGVQKIEGKQNRFALLVWHKVVCGEDTLRLCAVSHTALFCPLLLDGVTLYR